MDSTKNSEIQPTAKPKMGWPKLLIVASGVYFCWLMWLAYVAWVNVRAGNQ